MAANSFLEMVRSLRLYVPTLPIPLAEQFIRDRYRRILERRDWTGLRREGEFLLNDQKTAGTVLITRNSVDVVGTSTAFASTDVGRQFKAGAGSPIYTIATQTSATAITLDRVYGGATTAASTYHIFDGYVTAPTDFLRFFYIVDPLQAWRLRHWVTQEEITAWDMQRNYFGQPYVMADRMFTTSGVPQFECWPYNTTDRTLYYLYVRRGTDLTLDADVPIYPIRSDAIVSGALADAVRWPGTPEQENPYFKRPDLWKTYELEYEDKMIEIERRDEDLAITQLGTIDWANYPVAPISAAFAQSHAI